MTGVRDDSASGSDAPDDSLAGLLRLHRAISALAAASDLETSTSELLLLGQQTLHQTGGSVLATAGVDDTLAVIDSTYDAETISRLHGAPLTSDSPLADAVPARRGGVDRERRGARPRYPRPPHESQIVASVALPLIVANRVVGVLGVGWTEPHRFSDAERASAQIFADLCAVALDRHALLEAERVARNVAETGILRVGMLHRVTDIVNDVDDDATIVAAVVHAVVEAIAADAALVALRTEDGEIAIVHAAGYSDEALTAIRVARIDEGPATADPEPRFWHSPTRTPRALPTPRRCAP